MTSIMLDWSAALALGLAACFAIAVVQESIAPRSAEAAMITVIVAGLIALVARRVRRLVCRQSDGRGVYGR